MKTYILLLALHVVTGASFGTGTTKCPDGWTYLQRPNKCYKVRASLCCRGPSARSVLVPNEASSKALALKMESVLYGIHGQKNETVLSGQFRCVP